MTTDTGDHPVTVVLVDDDALVRAGLRLMLSGSEDVRVVGECADGAEVPAAVELLAPDVVLMDIRMPRVDGLTATERLRSRPDAPLVIVLTTFDTDEFILRALRAGASGFLLKDTPPPDIVRAITLVAAGEAMLSPTVTKRVLTHVTDGGAATRRTQALAVLDRLSEREREVAVAIGEGKTNAEVAGEHFMSIATVKAHMSKIMIKLDVSNRTQVALIVHDAGLV